jgi:Fe-Mn family superoxide dismutase
MHVKLYEGYVQATNTLTDQISSMLQDGRLDQEEIPAYSELKRRLGFEYNGMVLHEYYFGNLTKQGGDVPERRSAFRQATEVSFGGYENWRLDFIGVGKMRGVGWAICYYNRGNGRLSNHWTTLHDMGNVAGFEPIVVMDVWEHAFLLDHKLSDRPKYIEAFFSNLDWNAVDGRMRSVGDGSVRRSLAS